MGIVPDSFLSLKLHISKFCHYLLSEHKESDPLLPSVSLPQSDPGPLPLALEPLPNLQLDSVFLPLSPWQCICHIEAIVTLFKKWSSHVTPKDFPIAQTVKNLPAMQETQVRSLGWEPAPVFLPGEGHGQRSLAGCSLWGHKEPDTTERLILLLCHPRVFPSNSAENQSLKSLRGKQGLGPSALLPAFALLLCPPHFGRLAFHWTESPKPVSTSSFWKLLSP